MLKEHRSRIKHVIAVLVVILLHSGCAKVELKPKDGKGQTTTTKTTTSSSATTTPSDFSQMQVGQIPNTVQGDWQVGFQYNNTTLNSTMHLDQQGQLFQGKGTDDKDATPFTIESGTINGAQVRFYKKYANSAPVEYTGKIEVVDDANYHGPYMSGDYTAAYNGNITSNIWEAQMLLPGKAPAEVASQSPPNAPPGQQVLPPGPPPSAPQDNPLPNWPTDHTPDLSGKWEIGFEYNFHTIHSTMYLEQDRDRVTGHGVDVTTGEKFVIDSGWYHYPKLTLVRKYNKVADTGAKPKKGKGKKGKQPPAKSKGVAAIGTMTFKAQVTVVNDKDYQGPYLNGKTQGGGNWEGQLVK